MNNYRELKIKQRREGKPHVLELRIDSFSNFFFHEGKRRRRKMFQSFDDDLGIPLAPHVFKPNLTN